MSILEILVIIVSFLIIYYSSFFGFPALSKFFKDKKINMNKKKIIFTVTVFIFIGFWLFAFFIPRQNCLQKIVLAGDSYMYEKYSYHGDNEKFKTRNDALDYCMSQRLNF